VRHAHVPEKQPAGPSVQAGLLHSYRQGGIVAARTSENQPRTAPRRNIKAVAIGMEGAQAAGDDVARIEPSLLESPPRRQPTGVAWPIRSGLGPVPLDG
jgi:hypothetical protein